MTDVLERYPVVTRDGVTFHVDRAGWPVDVCHRCGGTGRYSYCQMYGDTCFECSGKRVVLGYGKAADVASEYRAAVRAQRNISGHDMMPGDEVRSQHAAKTDPYAAVVSVEDTGKWCGSSRVGNVEKVYHYQLVTFADGTAREVGPELWYRRVTITRAPYVERAQAAYVTKLRRSRKAA
jgi:hypothetical protein